MERPAGEAHKGRGCLQGGYCFLHFVSYMYAKPTQLWNVWLSLKLSILNHAASMVTKTVSANKSSYFLLLFFA